jgi:membrane fusion protein, multidrug efflux system
MRAVKKIVLVLFGLVVVVGGILGLKAVQIGSLISFASEAEAAGIPPMSVATAVAGEAEWEQTMRFPGTLRPVQGVTLTAEVGGIVSQIGVENGSAVKTGELLLSLDAREDRAQLASAVARRRLAQLNLERARELKDKRIVAQSELDSALSAFDEADAAVTNLQALIDKKTIRAPFDGEAGIRLVNLGQTVRPGDALWPVYSNDPIFVEFEVPQTRLPELGLGMRLRVESDGLAEPAVGEVTAINPLIDDVTRTVRVQGTLRNPEGTLRPGQFAMVEVVLPETAHVVAVPATAIVAAAYGDSVFVVEESEGKMVVRQQFVQTGDSRGDFIAIRKGVEPGERVVSAGAFKLSNGMAVEPNDAMQPEPQLNPDLDNS